MIVITVPHSECVNGNHTCDYMAPKAADLLAELLEGKLFIADVNRRIMDYNRIHSRYSVWRKSLTSYVLSNNVDWLLDIHSYPDSSESFGLSKGVVPEIVLLVPHFINPVISSAFNNFLISKGINAKVLQGMNNDITEEVIEYQIKTVLIEFNEGLSDNRLKYIINNIAQYVKDN